MWGAAMATGVAVLWMACLTPAATTCADGSLCSAAQVCAPAGGCVDPAQLEACEGVADGEPCELAGIGDGRVRRPGVRGWAAAATASRPRRGRATTATTTSGDGCRADCAKVEVCGDAIVDAGEACDDGNGNPVDGCDACVATTWRATAACRRRRSRHERRINCPGRRQMVGAEQVPSTSRMPVTAGFASWVRAGTITTHRGHGRLRVSWRRRARHGALLFEPSGVAVDGLGQRVYIADAQQPPDPAHRSSRHHLHHRWQRRDGLRRRRRPGHRTRCCRVPASIAVDGLGAIASPTPANHRIRHVDVGRASSPRSRARAIPRGTSTMASWRRPRS
jgi:cysteine-rich repeat protein